MYSSLSHNILCTAVANNVLFKTKASGTQREAGNETSPGKKVMSGWKPLSLLLLQGSYSSDSSTHNSVSSAWVDFHFGFLSSWEARETDTPQQGWYHHQSNKKNCSIKCSVEKWSITSGWWQVLMTETYGRSPSFKELTVQKEGTVIYLIKLTGGGGPS